MILSCGGSSAAPSVIQIAGHWTGTAMITSVTGGDCLYPSYASLVGTTFRFTMDLQQSGNNLTATDETCSATGSIDGNRFTLTLAGGNCTELETGTVCANGAGRDTRLIGLTTTGVLDGSVITGTYTQVTSVYPFQKPTAIDNLTIVSSFSLSR